MDCTADLGSMETWELEKKMYCCRWHGVACKVLRSTVFTCDWDANTAAPWGRVQRAYCCRERSIGCLSPTEEETKRAAEFCESSQRNGTLIFPPVAFHCCRRFGIGCPNAPRCFEGNVSAWGLPQRDFCCTTQDVACTVRCGADASGTLNSAEALYCCKRKGTSCSEEYRRHERERDEVNDGEDAKVGRHRVSSRARLAGNAGDLSDNPKQLLRHLRWALLWASEALRQDPSRLIVRRLGALMANSTVPPNSLLGTWSTTIPRSWNSELLSEEKNRIKTEYRSTAFSTTLTRNAQPLGSYGEGGVYIEYDIVDEEIGTLDSAANDVDTTWAAAAEGNGALGSNGLGPQVNAFGGIEDITEKAPAPSSDTSLMSGSSLDAFVWIPVVIGSICLVGAVVLMVTKGGPGGKKREPETLLDISMAEMDDCLDSKSCYEISKPKQTVETGCI